MMMKPKIIIIAIAPFYQGKVLWVEQLFDFLDLFTNQKILLPKITVNKDINLEANIILEMVENQYANVDYYKGDISEITNIEIFLQDHLEVIQKIMSYFAIKEEVITLELINQQMYWLLANQYQMMLEKEHRQAYTQFLQILLNHIYNQCLHNKEDVVILAPIELAYAVQEKLKELNTHRIYMYGDDFLEDETEDLNE